MSHQIFDVEKGVVIKVSSQNAAVIVEESGNEIIYLPNDISKNSSTYYVENGTCLDKFDSNYAVFHKGKPDNIEVFE